MNFQHSDEDFKNAFKKKILMLLSCLLQVLGLDGEWIPGENPVALLQLATQSGLVILLRLCALQTIPQEFKSLMSDKGLVFRKLKRICFSDLE